MNTSEQIDKISPAILAAHIEMGIVNQSGENKFDHYKYAKLKDYYKACRGVFNKHGVFVCESIAEAIQMDNRKTKKGENRYATRIRLKLRMIHSSGQWIEVESDGEGQDVGDKSTYKAITGARKYGIAMAANLSTSDDPEQDEKESNDSQTDKNNRPRASSQNEPSTPKTDEVTI